MGAEVVYYFSDVGPEQTRAASPADNPESDCSGPSCSRSAYGLSVFLYRFATENRFRLRAHQLFAMQFVALDIYLEFARRELL